ncbi:MAG: glycerol-3-phosphate dehydrogenase [Betaproteobacteria bacterium]|nr:MAG: glycerol-3-phosphate dehydrogenase [Betaproteobacteria bacterium]
MRIAVLGGGHGAYAAAADLSEQGHEVRLWRRDAAALQPLQAGGAIALVDQAGRRKVRIAKATADAGEAVRGAELVVVPAPATAQGEIAAAIAPHLTSGQVVFLPPGTFGSYVMAEIVRASGSNAQLAFAETGTLPYLARKRGPAEIAITVRAVRLPTGVYPAARAGEALGVIRSAYPSVQPCGNALSGALMNAGPVIHPPLIVLNAAPLEKFERWDIHNEGTQPSVRAVTDRLDGERVALREALGFAAPHFPLADHYTSDRWMYGDAHRKLVDSGDWRERIDLRAHRYMTEDMALGLAFLVSVAKWAGVDAPVAQGLLAIAGAILGRDLRRGPRTLEALGLVTLARDEMTLLLHEGRA